MKNRFFIVGILVIVLVFGMAVIGCDDGNGGDNGGGSGFMGTTLNLNGQVWTRDWDENDNPTYERFTGSRTINPATYHICGDDECIDIIIGGSGSIINGQLSFSIGTPSELISVQEVFGMNAKSFNNFNISPSSARAVELDILYISGGEELDKRISDSNTSEDVFYYYVDRDVTITGSGKKTTHECDCIEYNGYCDCEEWEEQCHCGGTYITRNLNLNLKTGWNVVTVKHEWNERNNTSTMTVSTGDSSRARWILYEYDDYSMNIQGFTENTENVRSFLRSKH